MEIIDFSSTSIDQLFGQLQSSPNGLDEDVAQKRIKDQNKVQKHLSRFGKEVQILSRQFLNPLVFLLIVAVILSAILGQSSDAIIILFILIVTGFLGFVQEANALRAFEKLQQLIESKHTVLRSKREEQVSTREVVAGDVVILDAGDLIPGDCRIIESNELHVNESTLTGESFPVEKSEGQVAAAVSMEKKFNCLWQGTNVVSGSARALVVNTGSHTVFGKMAHSLTQTTETAFEKGIRRFGFFLLRITIVLSLVILVGNLYFKKPLFDSVLFSLALAVGMAPELLPAIMTFAMSAGAKRMMKKKVIVKKLSSIFNFGEVNVLCTDKTGTITEGKIAVRDFVDAEGKSRESLSRYAWLNAHFQNGFTNPIDDALSKLQFSADGFEKINEVPYDFIRKRISVAVTKGGQRFFITKGAFANILEICDFYETGSGERITIDAEKRKDLECRMAGYCGKGFRALGLSYKELMSDKVNRNDENQMTFLGFILLEDPLKESAITSIQRLEQLHIGVKIITGDNQYAARKIAMSIGMKEPAILTGEAMDKLNSESLVVRAREIDVFAEIEPHQKERVIKALQKSNFTVAYIGDGINDVAAINAADIGISTNNAVDIAKEAADFVLLDKDLGVLADGIVEGRKSFANSMKYIFVSTGGTFGNMFSVAGASLLLPFMPMLPKQILLTNLLSDFPFLSFASDRVDEQQLERPGKWDLKLIRKFMVTFGLHSSVFDFITFYVLYVHLKLSGAAFQTGWFLESTIASLLLLFVIRTPKPFIKSQPSKLLLLSSAAVVLVTLALMVTPLASVLGFHLVGWNQVFYLVVILIVYLVTADMLKVYFFRKMVHRDKPD